jgi:hypothetical protein
MSFIVTVGGVAAAGAGLLLTGQEVRGIIVGPEGEGVLESAVHETWLLLMIFAVLGLHTLQQRRGGAFGEVAAVVSLFGLIVFFAVGLPEVLLPGAADENPAPWVMPIFFAIIGVYVLGLALFAAATWRARVLPRGASGLLLASVPIGAVGGLVTEGALLPMGAAFLWLGVAALRTSAGESRSRVPGAAAPVAAS